MNCKKKKKSYIDSGDHTGAHSYPVTITEPKRKKKYSASFLARTPAQEAAGSLFTGSQLPFPSVIKALFFLCLVGTCTHLSWLPVLNCDFSSDAK